MKKEGSRKLIEEQELMREQIRAELRKETEKISTIPSQTAQKPQSSASASSSSKTNPSTTSNVNNFEDFEAMVLANLQKAAATQNKT